MKRRAFLTVLGAAAVLPLAASRLLARDDAAAKPQEGKLVRSDKEWRELLRGKPFY